MQEKFLIRLSRFKGCWLFYCTLFKLLPVSWRTYRVKQSGILVDLADPPQFAYAILRRGEGDPATTNFVRRHLGVGDVFIDVGANWGFYTYLASQVIGPKGTVVALEPSQEAFGRLQELVKRNSLSNVSLVQVVAGESGDMWAELVKPWYRQSTGSRAAFNKDRTKLHHPVPVVTLDKILQDAGISHAKQPKLIKIDVEGAELFVLRGARETLQKYHPVVVVEAGENCARFGYDPKKIIKFMEELGYEHLGMLDDKGPVQDQAAFRFRESAP